MSILKICAEAFPDVKRVVFKDVADFHCNGKRVLLSYYSLLLYGQTWYERHFKARPVHKEDNETLDEFRKLLNDKPKKGVFSFYEPGDYENWHRFFESYKKTNDCGFFHEYQGEFESISLTKLFYSSFNFRKIFNFSKMIGTYVLETSRTTMLRIVLKRARHQNNSVVFIGEPGAYGRRCILKYN